MKYEEKFKDFIRAIGRYKDAEHPEPVCIHHPEVLGDNYEELVESMNRLADAQIPLIIIPRSMRNGAKNE